MDIVKDHPLWFTRMRQNGLKELRFRKSGEGFRGKRGVFERELFLRV